LPFTYYHEHYCQVLGRVMLGYTMNDLNNMKYGVDSALLVLDSDEHPAIHNYLVTASDFLGGLWAEGYFDNVD
jgi:hypothetical protein